MALLSCPQPVRLVLAEHLLPLALSLAAGLLSGALAVYPAVIFASTADLTSISAEPAGSA